MDKYKSFNLGKDHDGPIAVYDADTGEINWLRTILANTADRIAPIRSKKERVL